MRFALHISIYLTLFFIGFWGCNPAPSDDGYFVTYLGSDTLAVESYTISETGVEASVMLRSPFTTLRTYQLTFDEAGHMQQLETSITRASDLGGTNAAPFRTEQIVATDTGFDVSRVEDGEETTLSIEATPDALPFLDMIHWPFDLMLDNANASSQDMFTQTLLAGRRAMPFEITQMGEDSVTVKHPFRGTMGVTVQENGRLAFLDAANTTRKVRVFRSEAHDVEQVARSFADRPFGPLSGRAETVAKIDEATITVDYGTPSKRGREVFGKLVPYGQVWRTGANRATHFVTDADLVIGDVSVPAGTYTLYTIPEADGGILMINKQTDQGGTTYNEDQDLGRVTMTRISLDAPVETFTIAIAPPIEAGSPAHTLQLQWDSSAFTVPLRVQ